MARPSTLKRLFKYRQFNWEIIILCVRWYVSYKLRRENRIWHRVKVRTCQYLNNLIEQDHRTVKARVGPMLGFKTFANAARTIAGIELLHRIRKGQFMLIRKPGPKAALSMQAAWKIALA